MHAYRHQAFGITYAFSLFFSSIRGNMMYDVVYY
uniref:Uncharacterized protein n=1 Tax=Rhizophora mucronata TaxID=61149 RepID=A0A2P2QZH6_RHIMU